MFTCTTLLHPVHTPIGCFNVLIVLYCNHVVMCPGILRLQMDCYLVGLVLELLYWVISFSYSACIIFSFFSGGGGGGGAVVVISFTSPLQPGWAGVPWTLASVAGSWTQITLRSPSRSCWLESACSPPLVPWRTMYVGQRGLLVSSLY